MQEVSCFNQVFAKFREGLRTGSHPAVPRPSPESPSACTHTPGQQRSSSLATPRDFAAKRGNGQRGTRFERIAWYHFTFASVIKPTQRLVRSAPVLGGKREATPLADRRPPNPFCAEFWLFEFFESLEIGSGSF